MKVLFVCRSNTGRSQVAMEFYNRLTDSVDASSAGTRVDNIRTVGEKPLAPPLIEAMRLRGFDIASNLRNQIHESDLENFDKIIVMSEPQYIQDWLKNSPKYVYWDIEDPAGQPVDKQQIILDEIENRIKEFIKDNS